MRFKFFDYINEDNITHNERENTNEVAPVFLAFAATNTLMMAYRFYKEYMTKASRSCGPLKGRDKNLCMLKYQLDALEAQKGELERGLKDCEKSNEPKKCKKKIDTELKKTNTKLNKIKKNFNMLYKLAKQEERKK